jgi:hypothetical protein
LVEYVTCRLVIIRRGWITRTTNRVGTASARSVVVLRVSQGICMADRAEADDWDDEPASWVASTEEPSVCSCQVHQTAYCGAGLGCLERTVDAPAAMILGSGIWMTFEAVETHGCAMCHTDVQVCSAGCAAVVAAAWSVECVEFVEALRMREP